MQKVTDTNTNRQPPLLAEAVYFRRTYSQEKTLNKELC